MNASSSRQGEHQGKQSSDRRHQYYKSIWYEGEPPAVWMYAAEKIFATISRWRRRLYRMGWLRAYTAPVPVIVVGNITAGGTGKTPFVIWLVEYLKQLGFRPGVVSRGYGGKRTVEPMLVTPNTNPNASGDEALLIARRTEVPVMVGKKRAQAAARLVANHPVNVIVSDDGLQHYALRRDVEIALLDSRLQLGNGHLLPLGPLREPKARLDEVDLVVYKGEHPSGRCFQAALMDAWNLAHPAQTRPLASFIGQPVNAMAGIAQPEHFFRLLAEAGVAAYKRPLPDHHLFRPQDFAIDNDYPILITEKDAVKCRDMEGKWKKRVWVVPMTLLVPEQIQETISACLKAAFKHRLKPLPATCTGNNRHD